MRIPAPLRRVYKAWMIVGKAIGTVVTAIILTVLWFSMIALYAIVRKIATVFGGRRTVQSYWKPIPKVPAENMQHPF